MNIREKLESVCSIAESWSAAGAHANVSPEIISCSRASAELFSACAHFAGSAICNLRVPAHGSCETEVRIYRQREPVIGDARVNSMFEAEQPHDFFNLA